MRRALLLFSFGMLLALADRGASAQTMAERYATLLTEYKNLENEWSTRFSEKMIRNAPSPDPLIVAKYLERPVWIYTKKFLDLAEENPDDPIAVEILCWVIQESWAIGGIEDRELTAINRRAVELLETHGGLDDDRTKRLYAGPLNIPSPWAEHYLRTALKNAKSREIRGLACHTLPRMLIRKELMVKDHWVEKPPKTPLHAVRAQRFNREILDFYRSIDVKANRAEVLRLLDRAIDEFGDVIYIKRSGNRPDLTIRESATQAKAKIQELFNENGN